MKNCYLTNKIAKKPKQYSKKMIITYIKRKDLCGKGRDLRERERATAIMKKLFIKSFVVRLRGEDEAMVLFVSFIL